MINFTLVLASSWLISNPERSVNIFWMNCSMYRCSLETWARCRPRDRRGRRPGSGPWGRCLAAIPRSRWSPGCWWAATHAAWGIRTPAPPAHHTNTLRNYISMADCNPCLWNMWVNYIPVLKVLLITDSLQCSAAQYLNDAVTLSEHLYILHFQSRVLQSPADCWHCGLHAVLLQTWQTRTQLSI